MISGRVVANQGPVIPIVVRDADGEEHSFAAIVDTGFTGWMTLPRGIISALGLSCDEQTIAILADGTSTVLDTYHVTMIWDNQPKEVLVDELESEPLVGMRLLDGFRLVVDAIDGGPVRIERS